MNYIKIDINSEEYKKLSDRQKLKTIKKKIEEVLNNNQKNTVVTYKGKKEYINKKDYGYFKNLVERESALEKKVKPLYTVLLSSNEYKKMSKEEKIEVLESKIDHILNTNKKASNINEMLIEATYKGQTKYIRLSQAKEINELKEAIKALKSNYDNSNYYIIDSKGEENNTIKNNKTKNNKKKLVATTLIASTISIVSKYKNKIKDITIKTYQKTKKKIKDITLKDNTKKAINKGRNFIVDKNKKIINSYKKINLKKYAKRIFSLAAFTSIGVWITKRFKNLKVKGLNLLNKTKSYFKKENRITNNYKRRLSALACAFLIFTSLVLIKNNNKNSKNNNDSIKETTSQSVSNDNIISNDNNETNETIKNDSIINTDTITNITETPSQNDEKESISFDDIVTISEGSEIYTNSYDASYETNGLEAYFDNDYERNIEAVVYQLDNNIYIVYESDSNAIEKQKELENSGAVLTAVLVTRTDLSDGNSYEGYYSANHVRVKTR